MARRRRPHYPLKALKAAFSDAARLNRTLTGSEGAETMGMEEPAIRGNSPTRIT
jgi:hypothetical protein